MSPDWLTDVPPVAPAAKRKLGRAFGMSIAAHAGFAFLLLVFMSVHETPVDTKAPPVKLNVVYIPGPAGGGGGNPAPASAKTTEIPRHELPKPITITPVTVAVEPPRDAPIIDVPIETSAASLLRFAGVNAASLDPGGGGRGRGAGPGPGGGVGDGEKRGTGGGPPLPGGDITMPAVIRSVEPKYTAAALTAKLSGTVELEVVVLGNGTVGQIKVVKSLDKTYGLDQEAINAARQWLFQPSTQNGRPVDVIVKLILEFHIR